MKWSEPPFETAAIKLGPKANLHVRLNSAIYAALCTFKFVPFRE